MAKEAPYPLRVKAETEQQIQQACDDSKWSKAAVIRESLNYGLKAIDWKKLRNPPIRQDFEPANFQWNERPGPPPLPKLPPLPETKPFKYKLPRNNSKIVQKLKDRAAGKAVEQEPKSHGK